MIKVNNDAQWPELRYSVIRWTSPWTPGLLPARRNTDLVIPIRLISTTHCTSYCYKLIYALSCNFMSYQSHAMNQLNAPKGRVC